MSQSRKLCFRNRWLRYSLFIRWSSDVNFT